MPPPPIVHGGPGGGRRRSSRIQPWKACMVKSLEGGGRAGCSPPACNKDVSQVLRRRWQVGGLLLYSLALRWSHRLHNRQVDLCGLAKIGVGLGRC